MIKSVEAEDYYYYYQYLPMIPLTMITRCGGI
jgi:hypothetical protein